MSLCPCQADRSLNKTLLIAPLDMRYTRCRQTDTSLTLTTTTILYVSQTPVSLPSRSFIKQNVTYFFIILSQLTMTLMLDITVPFLSTMPYKLISHLLQTSTESHQETFAIRLIGQHTSSSFLACNSRLRSAIRRHHPPQRAVLSQICCFGERKIVMFQILLNGAEPCDAGTTQLSSPVCRRGGQQDPLSICVVVRAHNMPK